MVFAVWAAPDEPLPGLSELEDALVASVRLARAEPERLAHESSKRYGYPAGFLARYFEKLRYSFRPRERRAAVRKRLYGQRTTSPPSSWTSAVVARQHPRDGARADRARGRASRRARPRRL